jgi:hypothetical protein
MGMTFGRLMLDEGMAVVDGDGVPVGQLTERGEADFAVRRADGREVRLPYEAIQAIMGTRLVLKPHALEPQAQARPS